MKQYKMSNGSKVLFTFAVLNLLICMINMLPKNEKVEPEPFKINYIQPNYTYISRWTYNYIQRGESTVRQRSKIIREKFAGVCSCHNLQKNIFEAKTTIQCNSTIVLTLKDEVECVKYEYIFQYD